MKIMYFFAILFFLFSIILFSPGTNSFNTFLTTFPSFSGGISTRVLIINFAFSDLPQEPEIVGGALLRVRLPVR